MQGRKMLLHFAVKQKFIPLRAFKILKEQCRQGKNIKYNLLG